MNTISRQRYAIERIASARAEADLHRELRRVKEEKKKQRELSGEPVRSFPLIFNLANGLLSELRSARQRNKEQALLEFISKPETQGTACLTSEELPGTS